MTEEEGYRKIESTCDCCLATPVNVSIVVMENGSVVLLCANCLAFLKKFLEKLDVKWSEIRC